MFKMVKDNKGQSSIIAILSAVAILVVIVVFVSWFGTFSATYSTPQAIDFLSGQGYVVLAADEYADIDTTLTTLLLHNENETFLFPESVSDTVTLTAGNGIDTFSAWAEVVDNNPTSLSTVFAANDGYLVETMLRTFSVPNEIYIIELATANDGTNVIGRLKIRSDWTYIRALRSAKISAGDTIYYRMKAETALATVVADFRYYHIP